MLQICQIKKKMKCDFSYKLYAYDFDFDVMGID